MSGLDPGIHLKKKLHLKTMDGRVKPGHDATEDNPRRAAGNSAIDRFGLPQDCPAADEIPALLDGLALDKIDRAPKKPFQRLPQISKRCKIVPRGVLEGDEEIRIAAAGIEVGAARGRAENFEPRHAVPAAERGKGIVFFLDVSLHGLLPASSQGIF
jgi:hypothetical protein